MFKAQHVDVAPGYPNGDSSVTPTEAEFILHMTKSSRPDCSTADPGTAGYNYGPYFSRIPENPLNGKNSVQMIANNDAFPDAADGSHGWIYQPATLIFKADSAGSDENGKAYFEY